MRYLLTAALLLSGLILYAADINGTVRGKVIDKNTFEPLAGVYVIYGRNLGTTTSQEGLYLINTAPGRLTISFQFIGYSNVSEEVTVTGNDTVELNVVLEMKGREIHTK